MAKLSRRAVSEYIADQLLAGKPQQELLEQLAAYLIETRRTKELNLMVRDIQFYLASKGLVSGSVTTAFELTQGTKQALEAFAKTQTGANQVTLDTIVDPSVLGGMKLSIPGKELDTTISRKVTLLKTRYKKA